MNNIYLHVKNADLLTINCFKLFVYDEYGNLIKNCNIENNYTMCLSNGIYKIELLNINNDKLVKVINLNMNRDLFFVFNLSYINNICSKTLTYLFLTDKNYNGLPIEKGMIIFE